MARSVFICTLALVAMVHSSAATISCISVAPHPPWHRIAVDFSSSPQPDTDLYSVEVAAPGARPFLVQTTAATRLEIEHMATSDVAVVVRYHPKNETLGWGWTPLGDAVKCANATTTTTTTTTAAATVTAAPQRQQTTCDRKVLHTYRGIQIHDQHLNSSCCSDISNRPLPTPQACADLCCANARCLAFFHTTNQLSAAGNCSKGGSCCWLKPTFNSSRLHDACAEPADCVSGVLAPPPPPLVRLAAAGQPAKEQQEAVETEWHTVYRVAESSFSVDYLNNHNAGDMGGEVTPSLLSMCIT